MAAAVREADRAARRVARECEIIVDDASHDAPAVIGAAEPDARAIVTHANLIDRPASRQAMLTARRSVNERQDRR